MGPLWAHSMFPFERLWKTLGTVRTGDKNPAFTIMRHVRAVSVANAFIAAPEKEPEDLEGVRLFDGNQEVFVKRQGHQGNFSLTIH